MSTTSAQGFHAFSILEQKNKRIELILISNDAGVHIRAPFTNHIVDRNERRAMNDCLMYQK